MKKIQLGEFEELVLLTAGLLQEEAYGISISDELRKRTGRNPSIGALHTALNRLENKGFLKSKLEGATENRRGRRKRFYQITSKGAQALRHVYELRTDMIKLIPNLANR
ncbi:MAG TPA: PadR family transcriptional regulator [Cyclobacteriaceae bacterium]|jgi:DNA-binding PadR family transcriptional regulator